MTEIFQNPPARGPRFIKWFFGSIIILLIMAAGILTLVHINGNQVEPTPMDQIIEIEFQDYTKRVFVNPSEVYQNYRSIHVIEDNVRYIYPHHFIKVIMKYHQPAPKETPNEP